MKKIGIVTFQNANNYGAVLQNYALQTAIENIGYVAETVNYINPKIESSYKIFSPWLSRHPVLLLRRKYWELKNLKKSVQNKLSFDKFRDDYLKIKGKYWNVNDLKKLDYGLLITGSDQVWNKEIIGENNSSVYDLSFFHGKKASYAASCGSIDQIIDPTNGITALDRVTVREKDLADWLMERGIDAQLVCDPTLLLSAENWMESFQLKNETTKEKYVYLYYIDSGRAEAAKIAKDIASLNSYHVIYSKKTDKESIKMKYGVCHFEDGPIDFLNRILQSEFVVVSSFHGVVFSIIFHKEFYAMLHEETGSRVEGLLEMLNLKDRIVKNYDDYLERKDYINPINYEMVDEIIRKWRLESILELEKICKLL